jgi:hypothetical protein
MGKKSCTKVRSFKRSPSKRSKRKSTVKSYCRRTRVPDCEKTKIYHQIALTLRFQFEDDEWIGIIPLKTMQLAAQILNKKIKKVALKRDFSYFLETKNRKVIINITSPCTKNEQLQKIVNDLLFYTVYDSIQMGNQNYDIYVSKMDILI